MIYMYKYHHLALRVTVPEPVSILDLLFEESLKLTEGKRRGGDYPPPPPFERWEPSPIICALPCHCRLILWI